MTQKVSCDFVSSSGPSWSISVIADIDVKPSTANPELWAVTVPALAAWSVVYAETFDGFATAAEAEAAGLATAEAQGWAEYPSTGKIKAADFPSMVNETAPRSAKPSPAKRRKA